MTSLNVSAASIEVFVSILPQQYFVQRIGGDLVNVHVMVKPGQSPETFEPSPKIMTAYSTANVFFTIGMPFEKVWIRRVASLNSSIAIVNTQPEKATLLLSEHAHEAHEHENLSEEGSENWDPHTWLSPLIALQQAKIIKTELARLLPDKIEDIDWNYNKLQEELKVLDESVSERFQNRKQNNFLTFHPAFSYFAHQYGLTQLSIETGGKEPSARQIATIINRVKDKKLSYILIERQFNQSIPKTIADSIGAKLLVLDPLAYDYINNMYDIADKIDKALF